MKNTQFFGTTVSRTMKTTIIGAFLFAIIGIARVYAQDKETRNLENFSSVSFEGAYNVLLKEGSNTQIEIIGSDDKKPQDIFTEVRNGKLIVRFKDDKNNNFKWKMKGDSDMPQVIVTYKKLVSIENSGVVNLRAEKKITGETFTFSASGAGNFEVEFEVEKLVVDMSGAMSLKVSGKATEQRYDLSGAGSIEAYDLVGDKVKIDMSGAGSAKVHAKKSIDAEISGVGSIRYKGNPDKVRAESGILGSIDAY